MRLVLAGPVEGHLKRFYTEISHLKPNWCVQAGDFGVWTDPERMDRYSRAYGGKEFASRYVGVDSTPVTLPVLTIAGVHDDNRWLTHRQAVNNTEILPNVHWLAQGYRTTIGFDGPPVRVTGLGRVYS